MKHTLAVLVENKSGVLSRVASLFSRRGYNIDSLAVGVTEDPEISRMTIVVHGDDHVLEQVTKQLNKLIDVIKVSDIGADDAVERELALIKVSADVDTRAEIIQIADIFRARIVDVAPKSMTVEVTGDEGKINAIEKLLRQFGIKEMVRTGKIALVRGPKKV
jgi:acetolactate synthase I/III small subunit